MRVIVHLYVRPSVQRAHICRPFVRASICPCVRARVEVVSYDLGVLLGLVSCFGGRAATLCSDAVSATRCACFATEAAVRGDGWRTVLFDGTGIALTGTLATGLLCRFPIFDELPRTSAAELKLD